MVGRVVAGLDTGMNTATAGVWQAETSKMRSRGKLVIIQMANCIAGFSISNWLTLGFSFTKGSVAWRFPLAFQIFFTAVIWALCPFLPDSPRLLIGKGRHQEAYEVLAALEGHGATIDYPAVKQQFNIIKDVLDRENMNTYTWFRLLSGKGPSGVLRRMILGAWMQAMNQISGINVTSYYMTYGISELSLQASRNRHIMRARILAAAGSVDYPLFPILAHFVIERYGRRRVMMVSAFACYTCWIIITIVLTLTVSDPAHSYQYGAVAVSFFFAFFASFSIDSHKGCITCHSHQLDHELYGCRSNSIGDCQSWMEIWIIWAVICASFIPITYFFYLEIANRSLKDIDRFFESKSGLFIHRNKIATQLQSPQIYEGEDLRLGKVAEEKGLQKSSSSSGNAVEVMEVEHKLA
ncbi:hypothetical protein EAF04_006779 [Stromatinia cepivora]|nr:hypothetical protein EAF04_006779 [Stromatinia cepivora]